MRGLDPKVVTLVEVEGEGVTGFEREGLKVLGGVGKDDDDVE